MGCIGTRFGAAEDNLVGKMKNVGFQIQSPDEIIETVRRYALDPSDNINPNQLSLIQEKLALKREGKEVQTFYAKTTRMQSLLLAGVLLSLGSPKEKAAALYEIRDEAATNALTKAEVTELVKAVYDICLDVLPVLAPLDEDDNKYLAKVRGNLDGAIEAYREIAMGKAEKVDKATFAANIENHDQGRLSDPAGIRDFALTYSKAQNKP